MTESAERRAPGRPRRFPPGRVKAAVRFTPTRYADLQAAANAAGAACPRKSSIGSNGPQLSMTHSRRCAAVVCCWQAPRRNKLERAWRLDGR
jgi:hypothetical protein